MTCPCCRESARFVEYRPKTAQSLVGTFPLDRAYYHCRSCGAGTVPWDEVLEPVAAGVDARGEGTGLHRRRGGQLRRGRRRGAQEAGRGAGLGIDRRADQRGGRARTSASGWKPGETFGAEHAVGLAQGRRGEDLRLRLAGPDRPGDAGPRRALRRRAGWLQWGWSTTRCRRTPPDGPGRRAVPPQFRARYVAGLGGQASLAEPMRKQAAQVGMDQAERWIALSDAGAGVEDLLRVNFGRVEAVILDFYHVAEHLGDLGRALHPADESTREEWLEPVVPPPEARGRRGGAGGVAVAARGRPRVGAKGPRRGGGLLRESCPSDGLPDLSGQGLGDRLRARSNRRARRSSASG